MSERWREDKFTQPVDAITIIHKSDSGTVLTPEALQTGRDRIAAGESLDDVSLDLALDDLDLSGEFEAELRTAGGIGSGNFGHSGRPGETGGSASDDITPRDSELIQLSTAIAQHAGLAAADEYVNPDDFQSVSLEERGRIKAQIVDQLAARIAYDPSNDYGKFYEAHPDEDDPGARSFVADKLRSWAQTSGDHSPNAVGMQHVVAQEFGLKNAAVDHLDSSPVSTNNDPSYVRAEYDNTQAFLRQAGITHVSLFRGVSGLKLAEGEQTINMQPASSWSTSLNTAQDFTGDEEGHILATRVPAARILSTAVTGRGCVTEAEVLVLGGPTRVKVFKHTDNVAGRILDDIK